MELHEGLLADLELVEVTPWGAGDAGKRSFGRTPFSLLFRGPKELRAPQQIYKLAHAELGALEIFLVPLRPDANGTKFEAVFA